MSITPQAGEAERSEQGRALLREREPRPGPAAREPSPQRPTPPTQPAPDEGLVLAELLVEDVSIDGMCGVY